MAARAERAPGEDSAARLGAPAVRRRRPDISLAHRRERAFFGVANHEGCVQPSSKRRGVQALKACHSRRAHARPGRALSCTSGERDQARSRDGVGCEHRSRRPTSIGALAHEHSARAHVKQRGCAHTTAP